jgi:hypothetical protein
MTLGILARFSHLRNQREFQNPVESSVGKFYVTIYKKLQKTVNSASARLTVLEGAAFFFFFTRPSPPLLFNFRSTQHSCQREKWLIAFKF